MFSQQFIKMNKSCNPIKKGRHNKMETLIFLKHSNSLHFSFPENGMFNLISATLLLFVNKCQGLERYKEEY